MQTNMKKILAVVALLVTLLRRGESKYVGEGFENNPLVVGLEDSEYKHLFIFNIIHSTSYV